MSSPLLGPPVRCADPLPAAASGNYRKAFFACRKHRIDLNVIVDHDPAAFCARIPAFVDQIPEVDHLNLFLTLIG